MAAKLRYTIEKLAWADRSLGEIETPRGRLKLTLGLGSGLSCRAGDAPATIWAIGDRGPNLKIPAAIEDYGLDHLEGFRDVKGAKLMPRPDIGPVICQLSVDQNEIRLVEILPLRDRYGRPISGLPIPPSEGEEVEPAIDLSGARLGTDPSGADTEGIAAHSDGSFFVTDEYAPSILKVDREGKVLWRWVPKGLVKTLRDARYDVDDALPKVATRRRLNRGFEAIALSPDERFLYVAFQSALLPTSNRQDDVYKFVRLWRLNAKTGEVDQQFIYPFDAPESFARDVEEKTANAEDLKLCEIQAIGRDRFLVLERITHSAKLYAVTLQQDLAAPHAFLKSRTKPSVEDMDEEELAARGVRVLSKTLVFSTDDASDIPSDLEGMVMLSAREVLLVNDNDFGVGSAATSFWRVRFAKDLTAI